MKTAKSLLSCLAVVVLVFIGASIFDIGLSVISARFYTDAALVVVFGVAGVFAAVGGFGYDWAQKKDTTSRWPVALLLLLLGTLFFFPLAQLEGGEYKPAFKAYGATMVITTLYLLWESRVR